MSTKQDNKLFQSLKTLLTEKLWIYPVLAGLILRLNRLTASSIWHDEGYTMWLIRYDFAEIIARTARDVHPPAYYLIAKPWVEVFGSSVFSIRFLSLIFSLGIIYLTYKIVLEVFSKRAAFWSALLVSFSPFMVRFGQEARMYGVVAFFTTLATYYLVKYIKERRAKYLLFYVPAMIIAMYTQYYAFFVIISHWIILAVFTPGFFTFKWKESVKSKLGVLDYRWWLANISLLLLYAPWFPVAYRQVTRVSGSYWIKPEWITIKTIPHNVLQFITYAHLDDLSNTVLGQIIFWLLIGFLVLIGLVLVKKDSWKKVLSLYVFGYLPMILVFTLSKLRTPVYQDRYFPFSAIALFVIWGAVIASINNKYLRYTFGGFALIVLLLGNVKMAVEVNHRMSTIRDTVESNLRPSDKIYSGELYTYLDGTYYLGYDRVDLISEEVDGYGETSLFYDQQQEHIATFEEAKNSGQRIWVIGKTGDKDYFSEQKWAGFSSQTYYEETKDNGLKVVLYTQN